MYVSYRRSTYQRSCHKMVLNIKTLRFVFTKNEANRLKAINCWKHKILNRYSHTRNNARNCPPSPLEITCLPATNLLDRQSKCAKTYYSRSTVRLSFDWSKIELIDKHFQSDIAQVYMKSKTVRYTIERAKTIIDIQN